MFRSLYDSQLIERIRLPGGQLNKEGMLQKLKALQRLSPDTSLSLLVDTSSASVRLPTHLYHQGIEADGE